MSETPAEPVDEAEENLFQQVRRDVLAKEAERGRGRIQPAPDQPDIPQASPTAGHRVLWLVLLIVSSLLIFITIASKLRDEPEETPRTADFLPWGLLLILLAYLVTQARRKTAGPAAPAWVGLVVSLALFVFVGMLVFTPIEMAWLVGVLILHESGHALGMQMFGYRDVQMFFIPFFGAAVRGEKSGVPGWQEAIVLLLGPLPGLLLGCAIYFIDLVTPQPFLRPAATWLVAINLFNLLPLEPLDGGRLCNRLLFTRFRLLEAIAVVLATVGLVFLCLEPGWICLSLSACFAVFVLAPSRYRTATAALALQERWPELPVELTNLNDAQWRDLFRTTREQFKDNPNLLVTLIPAVHRRALVRPESPALTTILLAVYLAAIALAIVTARVTNLGEDAGKWPIRIRQQVPMLAEPEMRPVDES